MTFCISVSLLVIGAEALLFPFNNGRGKYHSILHYLQSIKHYTWPLNVLY